MSAALKPPAPAPAAFRSAERASLAHAIAALTAASAQRAALSKACEQATSEVRAAVVAVERAEGAIATASANAVKHLTDTALGTAGEAPQTIRQARAALAEARDLLEDRREARAILEAQIAEEKNRPDFLQDRLVAAAHAVIRSETRERAAVLVERVQRLQREIVAEGSALRWLAEAGVFPRIEHGSFCGQPSSENIRHTIQRMETPPVQWAISRVIGEKPFAELTGSLRWQAAFEALKRDANAPLPVDQSQ